MKRLLFSVIALAFPLVVMAHGGGLDSSGCHTNRSTGDYHCHRGNGSSGNTAAAAAQRVVPTTPAQASGPTCHTGPRGGTYTITQSGRKNYKGC
jgi:hypothetical protein